LHNPKNPETPLKEEVEGMGTKILRKDQVFTLA